MALDKTTGYTGTLNGKLFSVDLATGDIHWTFQTDGYKKFRQKYFQKDDNSFVENIGKILPDGNAILRMYEELGAIFSGPVVADKNIFVASNDGIVYCLEMPL